MILSVFINFLYSIENKNNIKININSCIILNLLVQIDIHHCILIHYKKDLHFSIIENLKLLFLRK